MWFNALDTLCANSSKLKTDTVFNRQQALFIVHAVMNRTKDAIRTVPGSLCSGHTSLIIDSSRKVDIIRHIRLNTHIHVTSTRKPLKALRTDELATSRFVGVVARGPSYLLYCTRYMNKDTCFLIQEDIRLGYELPKIYLLGWSFNDASIYNNTLLSCTLVHKFRAGYNWTLVVNDGLCFESPKQTSSMSLIDRLCRVGRHVESWSHNEEVIKDLQLSPVFDSYRVDAFKRYKCGLKNEALSGLRFVMSDTPIDFKVVLYPPKKTRLASRIVDKIRERETNNTHFECICECNRDVNDIQRRQGAIGAVRLYIRDKHNRMSFLQTATIGHLGLPQHVQSCRVKAVLDMEVERFKVMELAPSCAVTQWIDDDEDEDEDDDDTVSKV